MDDTGGGVGGARTPLVYVAGSGRSGSTLLERALCTQPGWAGVGELKYVWRAGFLNDERCGCGRYFSQCPFWSEVVAAFPVSRAEAVRTAGLINDTESRRDMALEVLRRHLPGRGRGHGGTRQGSTYDSRLRSLHDAVAVTSRCDTLVNSSKSPAHGRVLLRALDRPVHVVHLVRDSRAVAYAWSKATTNPGKRDGRLMPQYPPARVARDWVVDNLLAESLAVGAASYQRVRYEDLVRDPVTVLTGIARRVGVPDPRLALQGARLELGTDHTVHGNPMRFHTGTLDIRADDQWRSSLPDAARRTTTALTAPLLVRYGYRLAVSAGAS